MLTSFLLKYNIKKQQFEQQTCRPIPQNKTNSNTVAKQAKLTQVSKELLVSPRSSWTGKAVEESVLRTFFSMRRGSRMNALLFLPMLKTVKFKGPNFNRHIAVQNTRHHSWPP